MKIYLKLDLTRVAQFALSKSKKSVFEFYYSELLFLETNSQNSATGGEDVWTKDTRYQDGRSVWYAADGGNASCERKI